MPFKDPNVQAAPSSSTDRLDYRNIGAPPENVPATEQSIPPVNIVGHPPQAGTGKQAKDAHPYSEDVKRMQNALLNVASELNIRHGKDNPDPELTKKIQDISKHVEGQGTAYGDGLWGANTQEALNGVYGFISELTKHMGAEVKQKYDALLKQMEGAGVGPGKQYTGIKDVPASAKTLYAAIRTVIDNWNDDIEKAMVAPKNAPAAQTAPAGAAPAGTTVPATTPAGTTPTSAPAAGEATQSNITPAGYKQTGDGQPAAPAGTAPQSAAPAGVAQPGPQVRISSYPFDLRGDIISMQNFQNFLAEVRSFRNIPAFREAIGNYIDTLSGQVDAATPSVSNWISYARSNQSSDGFSLAVGDDADALIDTNFNHNYTTARNMLNMLTEICSRLTYILEMLRQTKMFDDATLREQVQRGGDYIKRIDVIVKKIEGQLRSGKTPEVPSYLNQGR